MNQVLKYTIYKIQHCVFPHCYIGATRNFKARIALHKTHYHKGIKRHLYDTMRLNGGIESYDIIVIEQFDCLSRVDAEQRENFWINKYEDEMQLLNTYKRCMSDIPEDVKHKWYYRQRLHNMQKGRLYYYKNREEILARMKEKRDELRTRGDEVAL